MALVESGRGRHETKCFRGTIKDLPHLPSADITAKSAGELRENSRATLCPKVLGHVGFRVKVRADRCPIKAARIAAAIVEPDWYPGVFARDLRRFPRDCHM